MLHILFYGIIIRHLNCFCCRAINSVIPTSKRKYFKQVALILLFIFVIVKSDNINWTTKINIFIFVIVNFENKSWTTKINIFFIFVIVNLKKWNFKINNFLYWKQWTLKAKIEVLKLIFFIFVIVTSKAKIEVLNK